MRTRNRRSSAPLRAAMSAHLHDVAGGATAARTAALAFIRCLGTRRRLSPILCISHVAGGETNVSAAAAVLTARERESDVCAL